MSSDSWTPVRPELAPALVDARLQVHHAAQLASAFGISYAMPAADDSHTNLEWLSESSALASTSLLDVRVQLSVRSLALHVQGRAHRLLGTTMREAAERLRARLSAEGLDGTRYTLKRHFDLPAHRVADGAPFDANEEHLEELARWFGNGALVLERLRASIPRASPVRCWPHHFDIATLIPVRAGRSIGVGLEPGDGYYAEPYFYVNMHPQPHVEALTELPLAGGGLWHTHDWIGAVLPGSSLTPDPPGQEAQVAEFIGRATGAAEALLG
jgi:hypothetical protein